jgi:ATP-dependent helicase/DNAse subunit B
LSESPYNGFNAGGYEVKTLSASQLGSYAMCPRRYFFDRVLKISAPGTPEEGLDASEKGTIMHKCFELFAIDAKAGKITIGSEVDTPLKNHMIDKAKIAYEMFLTDNELTESINHRLYFQELTRGLTQDDEAQGVLSNFLQFITENHTSINGFRDSEFEMEFRLDRSFKAIGNDQPYFIKGYIDRIDIKNDEIRIVDYKSKKASGIDKAKLTQMTELKDMQLALYILYARRAFGDKKIESYLQTFKSGNIHAEFAKAATYEVGKEGEYLHYDEAFEQSLIDKIEAIKTSMAHGNFHYDDSDAKHCEYCDFAVMCR